jgi:hypothetical protein
MDAKIQIQVGFAVVNRIRTAPTMICLKRSPEKDQFIGRLLVWDAQGRRLELETIEVSQESLSWSVCECSGKKVILLVAKPGKLDQPGSAQITLKIKEPCSQAVAVPVRW